MEAFAQRIIDYKEEKLTILQVAALENIDIYYCQMEVDEHARYRNLLDRDEIVINILDDEETQLASFYDVLLSLLLYRKTSR
jgi:uncharacterized metal-binding protein